MVEANIYRGIEFIRISELPVDQKAAIKNWLNPEVVIKIQTETALLRDCLRYKDYAHWFENIYTELIPAETEKVNSELTTKTKSFSGLAFD